MTADFFRARLDQMIDLKHPLAALAQRLPWDRIEAALAPSFARRDREGRAIAGEDLFGPTLVVAGTGISAAGRPRLSIRLMASLLYLKHAYNLSDEDLVARWAENVVWQYFSGMDDYEPRLPCDATQIGRFRAAIGEAGVEGWWLRPRQAVQAAQTRGQAATHNLGQCPARSRTQARPGQHRIPEHAHPSEDAAGTGRARPHPATEGQAQALALHAPEVECIAKGKARKPYEFGVKASIAVTHQSGLMVGARTFPGNPYDGHILREQQLEQTGILLEGVGITPKQVVVDLGYRGVDHDNPGVEIIHRGKYRSLTIDPAHISLE